MNYDNMKELQSKFSAMDELVTVYSDKIIAVKKKEEDLRACFKNVLIDAQNVRKKYADVMPVGHAPTSRMEHLVCELSALVANAAAMVAAPPDMVRFTFINLLLLYAACFVAFLLVGLHLQVLVTKFVAGLMWNNA